MCHKVAWPHVLCRHTPEESTSVVQCEKAEQTSRRCESVELMEIPAYGACENCTGMHKYMFDEIEEDQEKVKEEKTLKKGYEKEASKADMAKKIESSPQPVKDKKFEPGERIRYRPSPLKEKEVSKIVERRKNFEPGERIRYQPKQSIAGKLLEKDIGDSSWTTSMKPIEIDNAVRYRPAGRG
jgi:hypothetical protein